MKCLVTSLNLPILVLIITCRGGIFFPSSPRLPSFSSLDEVFSCNNDLWCKISSTTTTPWKRFKTFIFTNFITTEIQVIFYNNLSNISHWHKPRYFFGLTLGRNQVHRVIQWPKLVCKWPEMPFPVDTGGHIYIWPPSALCSFIKHKNFTWHKQVIMLCRSMVKIRCHLVVKIKY